MPQHDLDIANGSGAAVRADINQALLALGTSMKGPNPPSAPQAGMLWLEDDSPSSSVWTLRIFDGVDWITLGTVDTTGNQFSPAAAAAGLVNLLDNAGFVVNQRSYVSGSAVAAPSTYTLDRWRVVTSGQSASWSDSAGVRTLTAPAGGIEQVIEGSRVAADTYVLAWTGTASATVNGNAVANGGTIALSGGANVTVRFSNGTVALPQLQRGRVATPFEWRHPALEIALCQRYAERIRWGIQFSAALAGEGGGAPVAFAVPKRAAPTLTAAATILNANANTINYLNISTDGAFAQVIAGAATATALVVDILASAEF
jgi:hypothetical protein